MGNHWKGFTSTTCAAIYEPIWYCKSLLVCRFTALPIIYARPCQPQGLRRIATYSICVPADPLYIVQPDSSMPVWAEIYCCDRGLLPSCAACKWVAFMLYHFRNMIKFRGKSELLPSIHGVCFFFVNVTYPLYIICRACEGYNRPLIG
jgi:hypothetical protein